MTEEKGKPDDFITRAFRLRARMIERKIRAAKTECVCGGFIIGRLAGPKNHLHARCDGCGRAVMQ